jgi:hypothetical protein
MRTDTPNTSIYLTRIDYSSTSESPLWSLQTNPSHTTKTFSQIIFGSTSSVLEGSLYVVAPVGNRYQVSRVRYAGVRWTYEFPLDSANFAQVFIEYAINAVPGGANTLVIANS